MSMNLWKAFAAGAVLCLAGCSSVQRCTEDADCAPAGRCDMELGACVAGAPSCKPMCVPHEECLPENVCEMRYGRVVVTSPGSEALVGAGGVLVKLSLDVIPGRQRNDPELMTLQVKSASGAVSQLAFGRVGSGEYQGWWVPTEAGRTELVGVLESAALKSEPLLVDVEFEGPVFTLKVPEPPARIDGGATSGYDSEPGFKKAWRRDEKVRLWVVSDAEDVAGESVKLTVRGTDGGGPVGAGEPKVVEQVVTGCDASYCGEVEVDLYEPAMLAFRGEFPLEVSGMDVRGNAGGGDGGVRVTRWKWQWRSATGGVAGTPAVGPDGTVYVGANQWSSDFVALSSEGEERWRRRQLGSVVASPIFGERDGGAFVAAAYTDGTRAHLIAMSDVDGGTLLECLGAPNGTPLSSPASGHSSTADEEGLATIISHSNGGLGTLTVMRIGSSDPCSSIDGIGGMAMEGNLLLRNQELYVPSSSGLVSHSFSPTYKNYLLRSDWPSDAGYVATSLSSDGEELVALERPSGAPHSLYGVSFADGTQSWTTASGPTAGNVAISDSSVAFLAGIQGGLTAVQLPGGQVRSAAGGNGAGRATLIGADRVIYVTRANGQTESWSGEPLKLLWAITSDGAFDAAPTIDCARDEMGSKLAGRPGTLYVGSTAPPALYAFIVDSRGLDVSAPWPKHQRDPWNTGNTATDLTQFACE